MTPNNPFEQQSQAPAPANKGGGKTFLWVIAILCGGGLLGGLVCCGVLYGLFSFGIDVLTESYKEQLAGDPVIVEHIGEIESLEMSLSKTAAEAENTDGDMMAFEVEGTKGSGTLLIEQDNAGDGTGIESAILVTPDGQRHDVIKGRFSEGGEFDLSEVDQMLEEFKTELESIEQ